MKRILILLFVLTLAAVGCIYGQQKGDEKAKARSIPPPPPSAEVEAAPRLTAPEPIRRDLSLRQRRELGLTIRNLVSVAQELKAEGEIDATMSRAERTAAIMVRVHDRNPQAFSIGEIDWDAVFEFIERLMGLIDKLAGLLQ